MKRILWLRLGSLGVRAITLGSRAVLVFFLARVLPAADVGVYGLVAATISYGIMVLGLDFYTYAHRELLAVGPDTWPTIIRDQLTFYGIVYVISLPIAWILHHEVFPYKVAWLSFVLLVIEHLAQEVGRLLIVLGRPLTAQVVLFIRSGAWVWIAIAVLWLAPQYRRIEVAVGLWALGSACALLLGVAALRDLPWDRRASHVDWRWIRRGLSVGSTYFAATLCFRGLFVVDRYVVQLVAGQEMLGVYTLYASVLSAVIAFLSSGVFDFLYPRVVAAYRNGDLHSFARSMRHLLSHTMVATAAILVLAAVGIRPIIVLIDRPIYLTNLNLFWVMLMAAALFALGMVAHYGLYAIGGDRIIVRSHVAGFVTFLAVSGAMASKRITGVGVGLAAGFLVICLLKWWCYLSWLRRASDRLPVSKY